MHNDIQEVLLTEQMLKDKVAELGAAITRDYADKEIFAIGILRGAVVFMADLIRAIERPVQIDFMAVSSYGMQADSSGIVRILKDLDSSITGKHVLIIEDIIDSGQTLSYLIKNLTERKPASIQLCTLMNKPERRKVDLPVKYVGFEIPNEFVVGYGLDYAEKYRNLPYLGVLKRSVYEK
ncbi:MAG: hypoxanthine phosphoribosyltransferase [Selenomonadales bacterium]|jgi:hypoxanthine phosphoribosyltransferase|nr:hypoxanthine phosphoribosyltransferase [Selenomonadales bacterium]MBQ2245729.1 hypoxanthine phosphoribosyltransferase [Selenomonadales bacterium]MBQ5860077.1 hypoxanthine phosphoribosyltransferase [Selenomonadales bacterium]MBR0324614.1 hypoxanthine phosphoribosyltransferase [Selenomonadales bacterium]